MGQARIWTTMSFVLVIVAACADAPTAPHRSDAGDAGASEHMLEPVIVVGTPECDPYYNPAACEDGGGKDGGTCMASAEAGNPEMVYVSGCTGGTLAGAEPRAMAQRIRPVIPRSIPIASSR